MPSQHRSITRDIHDFLAERVEPGERVLSRDIQKLLPWYNINQVSAATHNLAKYGALRVVGREGHSMVYEFVGPIEYDWHASNAGHKKASRKARAKARPIDLSPYVGGEAPLTKQDRIRAAAETILVGLAALEDELSLA